MCKIWRSQGYQDENVVHLKGYSGMAVDCMGVRAGLARYWWQRLTITLNIALFPVSCMVITKIMVKFKILHWFQARLYTHDYQGATRDFATLLKVEPNNEQAARYHKVAEENLRDAEASTKSLEKKMIRGLIGRVCTWYLLCNGRISEKHFIAWKKVHNYDGCVINNDDYFCLLLSKLNRISIY